MTDKELNNYIAKVRKIRAKFIKDMNEKALETIANIVMIYQKEKEVKK